MDFKHHPDPAIDFCVEVEELQAMTYNRKVEFDREPTLDARIFRAMQFRVGGDLGACAAKQTLREIEREVMGRNYDDRYSGPAFEPIGDFDEYGYPRS
jgi:hypothetical protein